MKKARWFLMGAILMAAAIGAWSFSAVGETPPPPNDNDQFLDMGMDVMNPPPPPGAMPGMGPMGGPGMGPMGGPGMGGPGMGGGMMMGPGGPGAGHGQPMMHNRQMALERIKQEDPKRFERLTRIRELAVKYRDTEDEAKKKQIEKELRPLVDQELRTQQEENKKRIEMLEKRIQEMKKILQQREQNWDEVVDYTVKEITGQNAYLRAWQGGGGPR